MGAQVAVVAVAVVGEEVAVVVAAGISVEPATSCLLKPHIPKRLTVQWHITDRCNLRCQHCYQDEYSAKAPSLEELVKIAENVFALRKHWVNAGEKVPILFTLTGGEPFTHPDFKSFLELLKAHPSSPAVAVLSNGTLIDQTLAEYLAAKKLSFVQLSVDGVPATHERIRGVGSFNKVLEATSLLRQAGVRVLWSFTAHQDNYHEFPAVARLAHQHKVSRLWSDRMIPVDREGAPQTLDADETRQYFEIMSQAKREIEKKPGNQTEIALARALQFQLGGGQAYSCQAGDSLITIMPDGSLYPCRRLPVLAGNVLETSLVSLYEEAPVFKALRAFDAPDACQACLYHNTCKGGLRCLTYAKTQNMFLADTGCIYPHNKNFNKPYFGERCTDCG